MLMATAHDVRQVAAKLEKMLRGASEAFLEQRALRVRKDPNADEDGQLRVSYLNLWCVEL